MSSPHLSTGSEQPPKIEGLLRLYSMEYCPFAHRVRLVLRAKNVPHDIVNINLINKPEWISKVHPEGKVPALDTGDQIVVESIDIANFLDEKYSDPPLYSSDEETKKQEKELISKIGSLTSVFTNIILLKEEKSPEEWVQDFKPHFDIFEEALKSKGGKYFGGGAPGMVDYMLWPWAERAGTIALVLNQRLPLEEDAYTLIRAWRKTMREHPVVAGIYHGPEKFHKVVLFKTAGHTPDYDSV